MPKMENTVAKLIESAKNTKNEWNGQNGNGATKLIKNCE